MIASPKRFAPLLLGIALVCGAPTGYAQDYPARPIHAISPFPAGTSPEVVVRFYSDKLAALSGATMVVESKAGALGVIGANHVARSAPDGYTILVVPGSSVLAAGPNTMLNVPFDPLKDFAPVTSLAKLPFVLGVSSNSPINSVAELTKHLEEKKGKGLYSVASNTGEVASALYLKAAGTNAVPVRYKDTPTAATDLTSGRLDFIIADPVFAINQSKPGGLFKPLAVTSDTRMPAMPNIPTMEEAGVKGFGNFISWWGVFAPAKTPEPIIRKLEGWFNEVAQMKETKEFLARFGADVLPGDSESLRKLLAQELKDWEQYVKLAGIEKK